MSPLLVDKPEKEKAIARAALRLFSNKGYAATSVSQIARSAGIGKGTIYEYFETKEDLFLAAARLWMTLFEQEFASRIQEIENPIECLKALGERMTELVDPLDPAIARMSVEILRQGILKNGIISKRRHAMKNMMSGMRRLVEGILLDGISKGIFKPEIAKDAEKIAINFLGYLDGIGLHSIMSDNHFDLAQQVDFFIQQLIDTILIQPIPNEPSST
ncbi:MAG: TetR/AcrR family transcriptional regulator [Deltaproteobacteria bacterium]|nr:TetR/AcrR family transcriptional regulator [Deltaproteobacteria bacterium]